MTNTNMVVSIAIDMKSLQNVCEGNSAGAIIPASDRTRTMLKIFDPIIFPRAISWLFFNALINDAASSGRLVPRAIIVNPITSSDIPSNSAIVWELLTVNSAPSRRTIRPIKKGIIALRKVSSLWAELFSASSSKFFLAFLECW